MIQVDNIQVFNFDGAFRGLRNPMNSWDKSDSFFDYINLDYFYDYVWDIQNAWLKEKNIEKDDINANKLDELINWLYNNSVIKESENCHFGEVAIIGPNDMKLAQRMIGGGPEEAKFLRQIFVTMDINAPFFWWKEMDTYKVGTTANSCSTMHKLTSREFASQDFSFDELIEDFNEQDQQLISDIRVNILNYCEELRQRYLETKDKRYWKELVRWLPESWLQKRTWTANYETIRAICSQGQRRNHKLQEWKDFCGIIENLPYGKELICYEKKE